MTNLVIDRSTDVQTLAWCAGEGPVASVALDGLDSRSGAWAEAARAFLAGRRPDRILVGTGPGSFAGVRAALAFAQGWAIGAGCEVLGLTSAAGLAQAGRRTAVVGDARRGLCWIALFDGFAQVRDIFLAPAGEVAQEVPAEYAVATPDARRIEAGLQAAFGARYLGGGAPTAARLAEAARANPALLRREPLPLYLSPAVRD